MISTLRDTYHGKNVFVTGHTGFKGAWLCQWLARLGAKVTGYALDPPTEPSHFVAAGVREYLAHHVAADVRDKNRLARAVAKANPDIVLHLAAQTVVNEGYVAPKDTFEVNVVGTANVLEAVRQVEQRCAVVVVSSDKCYDNREQVWGYRETDALGGHDPYSASKAAAELVVDSYRRSFFPVDKIERHGIRLASARAGNVIGGGDWTPDALAVDVFRSLLLGRPVHLRHPMAVRPWQHVLEPLGGYLLLASRLFQDDDPALCSAWNFGPLQGSEWSVARLVEEIHRQWGAGQWAPTAAANGQHESQVLRLCTDKARWQLGWSPAWSLERAVHETVVWYRGFAHDRCTLSHLSRSQISNYEHDCQHRAAERDWEPFEEIHS